MPQYSGRGSLNSILPDGRYQIVRNNVSEMRKAWNNSLEAGEKTRLETFKSAPPILPIGNPTTPGFEERMSRFMGEVAQREAIAKSFIAAQVEQIHGDSVRKAGVFSTLGFNFYDLRGPAYLIYPVNVHFRNTIPRVSKVNDGYGTMAHWKATTNPNVLYSGVPEGQRAPVATPNEVDYYAAYKEQGSEGSVTYTAEFAGEGYTDNLADEHLRDLHRVFLAEEGMIINGNSGLAGTNFTGFKLGTCPTPVNVGTVAGGTNGVVATHTVGAAGNLSNGPGNADLPYAVQLTTSNYVSVACVLLTAMGNPNNNQYGYGLLPTIASGLTPQYVETGADGSTITVNGGMSAVSAISTPLQATSGNLTIRVSIPGASLPIKGVYGYAWFVDVQTSSTGSLAGAKLAGITTTPFAFISGTATGVQTANTVGLATDNSYNSLDFDGYTTYAANTPGAYYVDLYGGSLTSQKNSRVTEIETMLQYIWTNYQTTVDEIWGDAYSVACLDQAIRWSGTSAASMQFWYQRDSQNNILGGYVVSAYQSRYAFNSETGSAAIPIRIHPMIPAGTLYFHKKVNPYPQSRIPFVSGMLVQREYYSIEWPQTSRKWPFGTYVHEVLAHTVPWLLGVITGIGPFVQN